MAVNQLALSWKDHHNVLISVFENLLEKKALVDCTLAAEGKFLKAHKIVLSACSPYLQDLLNQENDKHPIIFLRDVNFQDLKSLVEFVYSGKIEIPEDRLVEFLSVAEALQIKGLGGVENKAVETKQHSDTLKQRDSTLLIPRKRVRRHSNSSSSNSRDKNEITSASSVQRSEVQRNKVSKLEDINTDSNTSLPRETIDITEEFGVDVSKIKEEVINCESNQSLPAEEEQCINESVHSETGNEHSELAPKFEEVTFTEQYSNDVFHEESDVAGSVMDPVQNHSSSSVEYSGLSAEPLEGLSGEITGIVPEVNPQSTESSFHVILQGPSFSLENTNFDSTSSSSWNVGKDGESIGNSAGSSDISLEDNIHQCSLCHKRFKRRSRLRAHILTHSEEIPLMCTFCAAIFNTPDDLKCHLRTHAGEVSYRCPVCSKVFSEPSTCKRHLSSHSNERPFSCTICSSSFKRREHLKYHIRVHTGEKPFQCTLCKKRFNQKTNLKVHMYTHKRKS